MLLPKITFLLCGILHPNTNCWILSKSLLERNVIIKVPSDQKKKKAQNSRCQNKVLWGEPLNNTSHFPFHVFSSNPSPEFHQLLLVNIGLDNEYEWWNIRECWNKEPHPWNPNPSQLAIYRVIVEEV